jgi:hypothetical protein
MNENDFECLAKTRVNTPPMAKMTDDVQTLPYRLGKGCRLHGQVPRQLDID